MSATPATPAAARGGKYLTFFLGDEEYGIDVLRVREIVALPPVTRVPGAPAFVRGVVNLRGAVLPVLDLRERLGLPGSDAALAALPEAERAAAAAVRCLVVAQVAGPHGRPVPVGMLVDRVGEVAPVDAADVQDAPSFGAGARPEYLLGVARPRAVAAGDAGRVWLLLDADRVLAAGEVAGLAA